MSIDDKITKDKEVMGCFNVAMKKIKEFKEAYDYHCSDKVEFGGMIDDVMNPISLALSDDKFILYYSSHYIENPVDKITNTFVRYITATNENFSFKDTNQIREELHKLPDFSPYESSFRNNYLLCDVPVTNAVICNDCLRVYRCSSDSDLFQNFNTYRCDCGGTLSIIENGEKKSNIYNMDLYKDISLDNIKKSKKERKQKESMETFLKNEDDFDEDFFDADVLEFINQCILDTRNRVSRLTICDYVQTNLEDKVALNMLNVAFPRAYYNVYKYSKLSIQKVIIEDPITRPICSDFDYNSEMEKINNKKRAKHRKTLFNDAETIIATLDLSEKTKRDLAIAFENKGKKISRMKIAEYIENSIVTKNDEFIDVINNHFPDIYLESIKHVHKPMRGYLYESHPPKSEKFNEEFKKKYPPSKYKRSLSFAANQVEVKTPMDRVKNFIMSYPKIGNKELSHEINDAAFHKDGEYLRVLKESFFDRFERVRSILPLSTLDYLKKENI